MQLFSLSIWFCFNKNVCIDWNLVFVYFFRNAGRTRVRPDSLETAQWWSRRRSSTLFSCLLGHLVSRRGFCAVDRARGARNIFWVMVGRMKGRVVSACCLEIEMCWKCVWVILYDGVGVDVFWSIRRRRSYTHEFCEFLWRLCWYVEFSVDHLFYPVVVHAMFDCVLLKCK